MVSILNKVLTCIKCNGKERYEYKGKIRTICSKCLIANAKQNTTRYKQNHKEQIKQYNKQYYQTNIKPIPN